MIQGTVSPDGVPVIQLSVKRRTWPAIVDTGFNGDLELPEALKSPLKARFRNEVESALAGGQIVREDNYTLHFPFDDETLFAEATFVPGDQILIGTHLLREHRLTIDFVARTVLLERTPRQRIG